MDARTDKELLEAYATAHDDAAFAALVARYGPAVYRACRRMLGNHHDAEDAAQAAFVVLARQAGGIRQGGRVSSWLHRVARNVALEVLRRRATRARQQPQAAVWQESLAAAAPAAELDAARERLDAELDGLSDVLREAVILRYLCGCSEQEAAALAACPLGTMKWRASAGLAKLRARLTRRGLALDGVALAALLLGEAQQAVPATLVPNVIATATAATAAAVPTTAVQLAKGALKTLFWAKVKTAAAVVALTVGVAVGGGVVAHQARAHRAAPAPPPVTAAAWVKQLLARAEAAPWDALDLKQGLIWGSPGEWRAERRGEPGPWRIWQTDTQTATSLVLFDAAKWRRGVVVGRVMLLPAGELPAALAVPAPPPAAGWARDAAVTPWGFEMGLPPYPGEGVALLVYAGAKEKANAGPMNDRAAVYPVPLVEGDRPRGVWFRYAVYFDSSAGAGGRLLIAVGADERGAPPAADWQWDRRWQFVALNGKPVGLGLMTHGVSAVWTELKLVPLGPDLPLPPAGFSEVKRDYSNLNRRRPAAGGETPRP